MTSPTSIKPNWVAALGIPALIFIACFFISGTAKFEANSTILSAAIIGDMLIVAPIACFLSIRKTKVSRVTVVRVFLLALVLSGYVLASHANNFIQTISKWVSPVLEAMLIFYIGRKFYLANKEAKTSHRGARDFLFHCRHVMTKVLGNEKIANLFSSEIAVLYYAFIARKNRELDNKRIFSGYRENGLLPVLWSILSIFLIETIGMHFLLLLWNETVAWIIFALSMYTCIQLFAHIKAIRARPSRLHADSLEIHNGLAGDAYIQYENILAVEITKKIPHDCSYEKISLLKSLEPHNMVIRLKDPIRITRIFGFKKTTETILFFVDKPVEFAQQLGVLREIGAGLRP